METTRPINYLNYRYKAHALGWLDGYLLSHGAILSWRASSSNRGAGKEKLINPFGVIRAHYFNVVVLGGISDHEEMRCSGSIVKWPSHLN